MENGIPLKGEKQGVVVCPGPNMAYFDKEVSLFEMVRHIYGNANVLSDNNRPNLFIKELKMYVDFLKDEISEFSDTIVNAQIKKWESFKMNLLEGIHYYENLLSETSYFKEIQENIQLQLEESKKNVNLIQIPILAAV